MKNRDIVINIISKLLYLWFCVKTFVMTMSLLLCKNVNYELIDKMLARFGLFSSMGLRDGMMLLRGEFRTSCALHMCNNNYI